MSFPVCKSNTLALASTPPFKMAVPLTHSGLVTETELIIESLLAPSSGTSVVPLSNVHSAHFSTLYNLVIWQKLSAKVTYKNAHGKQTPLELEIEHKWHAEIVCLKMSKISIACFFKYPAVYCM